MTQPLDTLSFHRLIALVTLCLLAAVLLLAPATPAAAAPLTRSPNSPSGGSVGPSAAAEEVEWEEEAEWEWEEGEEEEIEWEWEEEEPENDGAGYETAAMACSPAGFTASVVASHAHDTLRLRLEYDTSVATKITVDYRLKGAEGALRFSPLRARLDQHGVLANVTHLNARAMDKVQAARVFIVRLDSHACERPTTQRLSAKHRDHRRTTWSNPWRSATRSR